jgi:peptide/nickel transport system permease protein
LLGVKFTLFPVYGAGNSDLVDRISHLTLPAIALATSLVALILRQTRAAVMNVMDQDYITFARARGLSRTRIIVGYALRNTALPVTTTAGLTLIIAISGTVLVESLFSLPGEGSLMVLSVDARDIPVVQALALFTSLFVVLVNLLSDAAALIIDPRTRTAVKG